MRNLTVTDARTYFTHIVPLCQKIVTKASSFFRNFNKDYDTFETFKEDFDVLMSDVEEIAVAFKVCEQMHMRVVETGKLRKM